MNPVRLEGLGAHLSTTSPYSSLGPVREGPPAALRLTDIPFPHLVQPLAMPPFDTQAPVYPLPDDGVGALRAQPWGSAQPAAPSTVSRLFVQLRQPARGVGAGLGCSVWPGSSCQGLICMQKGLGGIYRGLALGSCSRPRKTLGRRCAVGKIRTGPSAAAHALVTLQAANIEIIFIYNLFDHPASKRARLVGQRAPKWPNYLEEEGAAENSQM